MSGRTRQLITVLALAVGAVVACGDGDVRVPLPPPEALEAMRLRDLDDTPVSAAAWHGKVVVLNVWAVWCAPCRRELPALDRLARDVDPQRVAVVGIATDDDPLVVREFARRAGFAFSVWLDPGRAATAKALGAAPIPETYLIGPDGRVRERIRGAVDFDAPAWRARVARAQREL